MDCIGRANFSYARASSLESAAAELEVDEIRAQ